MVKKKATDAEIQPRFIGQKPNPEFKNQLEATADKVAHEGAVIDRFMLAGIANIDISVPSISRTIRDLKPGEFPRGTDRFDIYQLHLESVASEDTFRAISYAAFLGFGPDVPIPPGLITDPSYDLRKSFTVPKEIADSERLHNGG